MKQQERFFQILPGRFFLDEEDAGAIEMYLHEMKWLNAGEHILSAERPYAGNMNHVLRIHTPERTFILKQARPWVERHPEVPAPAERAEAEAGFFKTAAQDEAWKNASPRVLGHDPKAHILMFEDAGAGSDYSWMYQRKADVAKEEISHFAALLSRLHQNVKPGQITNREMQLLLHDQVFRVPFHSSVATDNCPVELFGVMKSLRDNHALSDEAEALGNIFLETGNCLVHGEYTPSSWLKTSRGLFVIDPDFCFCGRPEWDYGVMRAHLLLTGFSEAETADILKPYQPVKDFSPSLATAFCGAELIRRLCGPGKIESLIMTTEEKMSLMHKAAQMMLGK